MTDVLILSRNLEIDMHRGECHAKLKAEIGMMLLEAKDHQRLPVKPPEARREEGTDPPSHPQKETTLLTPGSRTSSLHTGRH